MKSTEFEFFKPTSVYASVRFTDDTVLTCAVAHSLMTGSDLVRTFHQFVRKEPKRGYGPRFGAWVRNGESEPYNSFGNGSAMRVSPVGWFYDSVEDVLLHAKRTAAVTHDHPEGIKGAQAVALAIYMARKGHDKSIIKQEIEERFEYDLDRTIEVIRPYYKFDVTCQGSVPEAIIAFLEAESYDEAVAFAISLGGDTDTQGCIAGSMAEAFYGGVPKRWKSEARSYLSPFIRGVADEFDEKFVQPGIASMP
jgi:ADP-ribosylglycohydrolase